MLTSFALMLGAIVGLAEKHLLKWQPTLGDTGKRYCAASLRINDKSGAP